VPRADLDKEVMDIANNLKEKARPALNAVKEAWYYTFYSIRTSPTKSPA